MGTNLSTLCGIVGSYVFLAFGGLTSQTACAAPDVLERSAVISKRVTSSAMLAVTRAGKRLVAVGERGGILYSDDNGSSWAQAKVPVSASIVNVFFVSDRRGWAVGHSGVVLHTRDGGESWSKQLDGKQAAALVLDAAVTNPGNADAAAAKKLAAANRLVADGPDKPFLDVYFSNENSGYIIGAYGLIYRTEDGGKSWIPWQDRVDNPKGKHLYSIRASDGVLYIAGEQGALFRSTDGGQRFVEIKTPYFGSYFGIVAEPGGSLLVYGLRGNAYWSADAGRNWQKAEIGVPGLLAADLRLADGSLILVSHDGDVLRSADGGQSFSPFPVKQPAPFTGAAQAADGSVILSGTRGLTRLTLDSRPTAKQP